MHIGNLRTALYTYLIAKKYNGKFILRIEDTDRERYVQGAEQVIYDTLRLSGLNWDEGPDIGGDYGPYVQSQRMGMFKQYAEKLVETGKAYYCFCTKERLQELRQIQDASHIPPMYDRHCESLSEEEIAENLKNGVPYVIRQKMPRDGVTKFNDEVYGEITVENSTLDDQILLKTDGMPTYNFANVVDDHLMAVTHIVRGNEYLASTPKYNLLYEAFGWDVPKYIHCPPVMKDKTTKLSKRNGDASFEDLIAEGYLTESVINFIALLGWAPKSENEIFTLEELINEFDVGGISKSPAIFDVVKLKAINSEYIRKLSPEEFKNYALPYIKKSVKDISAINIDELCNALQGRTEIFKDIPAQIDFIDELPDYVPSLFVNKKMKTNEATSAEALASVLPVLENIDEKNWNKDFIHTEVFNLIEKSGVKNGYMLYPLRVALSGKQFTPGGGIELAVIFGKAETCRRIKLSLEKINK
jgi:glutamyl-tRNA synthetase